MMGRWTQCASLVALTLSLTAPVSLLAQRDAGTMRAEIERLEGRVGTLDASYVQTIEINRTLDLASRLADGQLRYMLGEYEAAAIMLGEIVDGEIYVGRPGYTDARYLYADSLFLSRNYYMARRHFQEIVRERDPVYGLDAARRLLEVAFALNDYSGLEQLYATLESQAGVSGPEVAYVRAKALYFQGRFDEASVMFASVPLDHAISHQARYFRAVTQVQMGQFELAFDSFVALAQDLAAEEERSELLDLTFMALGRVRYEMALWSEAISAYNQVSALSSHYDDALYEISWSLIRQGEYRQAINNLEILMVVADDGRFIPEARLLRGDLLMRLDRFDEAVHEFETVDAEYRPVEAELALITENQADPAAFFYALVNPEEGALRLPTLAQPWFQRDATIDRALVLAQDIEMMRAAILESYEVVEELDTVLSGRGGVQIFPALAEGWGQGVELQNDVIAARVEMLARERSLLSSTIAGDAAQQYATIRQRRENLERQFADVPRTLGAMNDRSRTMLGALDARTLEVFRAEQEIEAARDEIEALRGFLEDQVRDGRRGTLEARRIRVDLDALDDELQARLRAGRALRRDIRLRQVEVGVADGQAESDRRLRRELREAIAEEERYLASRRGGAASGELAELDRLRERLDAADDNLDVFFTTMERTVAEQVAVVRSILEDERANLESYESRLAWLEERGQILAGEIALESFLGVQRRFSDLSLRANLGIIDVAWREKESLTQQVDRLFDERNRALRILDADFAEILSGD